jgi:hypothetical protein
VAVTTKALPSRLTHTSTDATKDLVLDATSLTTVVESILPAQWNDCWRFRDGNGKGIQDPPGEADLPVNGIVITDSTGLTYPWTVTNASATCTVTALLRVPGMLPAGVAQTVGTDPTIIIAVTADGWHLAPQPTLIASMNEPTKSPTQSANHSKASVRCKLHCSCGCCLGALAS